MEGKEEKSTPALARRLILGERKSLEEELESWE